LEVRVQFGRHAGDVAHDERRHEAADVFRLVRDRVPQSRPNSLGRT
jgi:hypothetical protein